MISSIFYTAYDRYGIMKRCWCLDPFSRPSLEDLETSLKNVRDEYWPVACLVSAVVIVKCSAVIDIFGIGL